MTDYPASLPQANHTAPVPRRIRAVLNDRAVVDTLKARYVWEWPHYPQYYIPLDDVDTQALVDEHREETLAYGLVRLYGLVVGEVTRPNAVRVYSHEAQADLAGLARFEWSALDAWFEEDEQVFVHPRDPYTRVDALRSTRHVRVELEGRILAQSASPVVVFETGLSTRYYLNRSEVDFTQLTPSETVTRCPYKGTTSEYWSTRVNGTTDIDVAWCYQFPTRELLPIVGLIAFYNDRVDIFVDGVLVNSVDGADRSP